MKKKKEGPPKEPPVDPEEAKRRIDMMAKASQMMGLVSAHMHEFCKDNDGEKVRLSAMFVSGMLGANYKVISDKLGPDVAKKWVTSVFESTESFVARTMNKKVKVVMVEIAK